MKRSHSCMSSSDFLDPDRELILDLSQEELRRRLNLQRSGLLDQLLERRVLTNLEAQDIESTQDTAQQVDILLDCFKQKTNQQFDELCGTLQQLGLGPIYDNLLSDDVITRHVEDLQQRLCSYYQEEYSMVDIFCMYDEGHQVRMEEIYVPIRTATYQKTPDRKKKRSLRHYTDLFQQGERDKCKLVVVKGKPLGGKTTFVQKICSDWARAITNDSNEDVFQKFKLVVPIILRLVKPGTKLLGVLQDQLHFLTTDQSYTKVIAWLLREETDRVLFLLDGLDEYVVSNSQEIFNIMIGSCYNQSFTVITTRAEGMSKLEKNKLRPMVEAELQGFTDSHIKQYVEKYFAGRQDSQYEELLHLVFQVKEEKILMTIFEPKHKVAMAEELYKMATNPGQLGILCLLWSHNKKISQDRVQLFTEYVCVLLKIAEKKRTIKTLTPKDKLISTYTGTLCKFGKLANTRRDGTMSTVFTMQEVEATVGEEHEEAMKYGFLYRSHPVSHMQDSQVSFIHKTIQEWLAAFYTANDEHQLKKIKYESVDELEQDTSFHQFLLPFIESDADSAHKLHVLCSNLFPQLLSVLNGEKHLETMRMYEEHLETTSMYFRKLLHICYSKDKANQIDPHSPFYLCFVQILDVLKHLKHVKLGSIICGKDELADFVHALGDIKLTEQLDMKACKLSGGGRPLGQLLLKMPKCTVLKMSQCGLAVNDLPGLLAGIEGLVLMKQLDLSHNDFSGGGQAAGELLLCLSSCCGERQHDHHAQKLDMNSCRLTAHDLQAMVAVIRGRQVHIKQLHLSENDFSGGGQAVGELLLCLSSCCSDRQHDHHVEKLVMFSCKLTAHDLQAMVAVVRGRQVHMQILNLSKNDFSGGGQAVGELLLCLFSCCSDRQHDHHVEKLDMGRCKLTAHDLQAMVAVIRRRQVHIKQLYLSSNDFSGTGQAVGELLLCLSSCCSDRQHDHHVEELDMQNCKLTAHDLQAMVAVIMGRQVHIKQLILVSNDFSGAGAALGQLLLHVSCEELILADGQLTASDLRAAAAAIQGAHIHTDYLLLQGNNIPNKDRADLERLLPFALF